MTGNSKGLDSSSRKSTFPTRVHAAHADAHSLNLLEQAPVAFCLLDSHGNMLEANRAACQLFDLTVNSLVGQRLSSFVVEDDQPHFANHCLSGMTPGQATEAELRMRKGDGKEFWAALSIARLENSEPACWLVSLNDVSRRKEVERSLRKKDELFKHAIEATRDGIWDWDIASGEVFFSPQWARLLGYEPEEVPQRVEYFFEVLHPDDVVRVIKVLNDHLEGKTSIKQDEVRLRTKSGEYRWFLDRGEVVERDSSGKPIRMVGTITDITQRRQAEESLRESQSRMRLLIEAASLGLWDWDLITNAVYFSPEWKLQLGYTDDELPNEFEQWKSRLHPDDVDWVLVAIQDYLNGNRPNYDIEFRLRHRDGSWRWIFARADVHRDAIGDPVRMMGCHLDITERRQAEAAQAEALNRLQKIASRIPGVVYQYRLKPDGTVTIPYASDGMFDLFQISHEDLAKNADVSNQIVDKLAFSESVLESARTLTPWVHEMQIQLADGTLRWLSGNSVPEREPDGSTIWHGFITDVTERKEGEAKLRQSEKRLREAQAISQIGNFHWDAQTNRVTWSDELYRIYEQDPSNFEPSFESYLAGIHPDDRARVLQQLQQTMERRTRFDHQYRIPLSNDRLKWVRARGFALVSDEGKFIGLEGTCQDISEQKRAEEVTASLETQLRESQKMEAIGTLAGGIAHDFNNILGTILGNVDVALPASSDGPPLVQTCLKEIQRAGDRARDLVQQILSFSRRQPTDRKPISLVPVIEAAAKLLQATLPARLTLDVLCSRDTPVVLADATQIEQVLLNLVTNAMQAMNGQRGHIRIHLDSVLLDERLTEAHGSLSWLKSRSIERVVRLIVSDNGPGMCPETISRIFEPFFTTKPIGQGTGLGLAVVHGIVQGHDGTVTVKSHLGQGATFTIYLPALVNEQDCASHDPAPLITVPEHFTSQHILYLDDDKSLLNVAELLMKRLGYRISCFDSHEQALVALRNDPMDFDLVVTDYNMPGMQGLEVAREIQAIRGDLPVVITSGYIDAELTAGAAACGVVEFIAKPFRLTDLYSVVKRLAKPR